MLYEYMEMSQGTPSLHNCYILIKTFTTIFYTLNTIRKKFKTPTGVAHYIKRLNTENHTILKKNPAKCTNKNKKSLLRGKILRS
jgi:hypothetical protein